LVTLYLGIGLFLAYSIGTVGSRADFLLMVFAWPYVLYKLKR
jgi:hypothetical protein